MKQWHPIFALLLRPRVEPYYEMRTTMPVGDAPREADFVLLRRRRQTTPPFRGLWRHLTLWNILEYKGPSVSPRRGDVEALVELGLGIERRLRAERSQPPPEEMSFWYLANRLGRRFLGDAEEKLGGLEPLGPGLWRWQVLGRLVFLVSGTDLPVEEDSLPLHVIGHEPPATELEVARLVMQQPQLEQLYGGWLATLHPEVWEEVEVMARTARRRFTIDLRPAIEHLGVKTVIEQVGLERVIEQVGEKEIVRQIGIDRILASLSAAERRELKRRLQ
ncbi:MAG TPA: hypothetical protein VKI65_00600 [Gemmataceae bacterium]|nr:hypothetical protein [Gemmataceae bacterium]